MMKIAISNIAWNREQDEEIYGFLQKNGVEGIEIAPTRIFPYEPYEHLKDARAYRRRLEENYGLQIASVQSIWYGREERIFAGAQERTVLLEYTRRAFAFVRELGCQNVVFGCPKNRNMPSGSEWDVAYAFFTALGNAAVEENVVLNLEANPEIYGTNFLNTTREVYEFIREIDSDGLGINYDFGTVIQNQERIADLDLYASRVNHVHISEPFLHTVQMNVTHRELIQRLRTLGYEGYVSLEMKNAQDLENVKECVNHLIQYVRN